MFDKASARSIGQIVQSFKARGNKVNKSTALMFGQTGIKTLVNGMAGK